MDEPSVLSPGEVIVGVWQVVQVLAKLLAEGWFARHAVAAGKMQIEFNKSVFKLMSLRHAEKVTCNSCRSPCED